MSSTEADFTYLGDIVYSAERIFEYISDLDREDFLDDVEARDAVNWRLLVIGEAVNRLSDEFKENHSELPWREITGLRNVVAHEYDQLIYEEIWRTLQTELPQFTQDIRNLLDQLET